METKIIDEIKDFWNKNSLFEGESKYPAVSIEFFEDHKEIYMNDVFAGTINNYDFFSQIKPNTRVLDLGFGVGFWVIEIAERTKTEQLYAVEQSFLYYFPTRIFLFKVPRFIHRFLAKHLRFNFVFSLRKK